jgi:hypothetical protein
MFGAVREEDAQRCPRMRGGRVRLRRVLDRVPWPVGQDTALPLAECLYGLLCGTLLHDDTSTSPWCTARIFLQFAVLSPFPLRRRAEIVQRDFCSERSPVTRFVRSIHFHFHLFVHNTIPPLRPAILSLGRRIPPTDLPCPLCWQRGTCLSL